LITAAAILLPLLLAAIQPFLPPRRWTAAVVAAVGLALTGSLPWWGQRLGGWLLPDPLSVHVAILAAFAWLAAALGAPAATRYAPAWTGCLLLALLSDGAGLTVLASGGAAAASLLSLPRSEATGDLLVVVLCGTGLALFGTAVLYGATSPALGTGWPALSWSALPDAGGSLDGAALGIAFALILLGLGTCCAVLPLWAAIGGHTLPPAAAMLAGPAGGVWLVVVLRLRGVLDADGHAVAPGGPLMLLGIAGLILAALCLRHPGRLLPAAIVALFGTVLFAFGLGGAVATAAGLLHLTLGCLALTAAASGSWPAMLGVAGLVGLPPFGVFATGFALVGQSAEHGLALAALFAVAWFAVAALALRGWRPPESGNPAGWLGVALMLWLGLLMPHGVAGWLQGIAAAAR
jgi:hydrogenase-4 component F